MTLEETLTAALANRASTLPERSNAWGEHKQRVRRRSRRRAATGAGVLAGCGLLGVAALTTLTGVLPHHDAPTSSLATGASPSSDASASARPTPSATSDPNVCGEWALKTSATGGAIAQRYGEMRNCFHVSKYWVVTTLGNASSAGAVGVYECTDTSCANGSADHPFAGFTFYRAGGKGGVTLLGLSGTTMVIDVNGAQRTFDLVSRTFH